MRVIRKFLAVCLAFALVFGFSACRESSKPWESIELVTDGQDGREAGESGTKEGRAKPVRGGSSAKKKSRRSSGKKGAKTGTDPETSPPPLSGPTLLGRWMRPETFSADELDYPDDFLRLTGFSAEIKTLAFWEFIDGGRFIRSAELLNTEEYRQALRAAYLEYVKSSQDDPCVPTLADPEQTVSEFVDLCFCRLEEKLTMPREYTYSVEGGVFHTCSEGGVRYDYDFVLEGDRLTVVSRDTGIEARFTREK